MPDEAQRREPCVLNGAHCQLAVTRRRNAIQLRSTDPAVITLAQHIGPALDNAALAAALNQAGHRTGTGAPFDTVAAANLRHYHHIAYPGLLADGELTPRQIADRIGVSVGTIHYWINAGFLSARRGPANRWCIPFPPETESACRDRAAGSAHPSSFPSLAGLLRMCSAPESALPDSDLRAHCIDVPAGG